MNSAILADHRSDDAGNPDDLRYIHELLHSIDQTIHSLNPTQYHDTAYYTLHMKPSGREPDPSHEPGYDPLHRSSYSPGSHCSSSPSPGGLSPQIHTHHCT